MITHTAVRHAHEGLNTFSFRISQPAKYVIIFTALKRKKADIHLTVHLTVPGASVDIVGIVIARPDSVISVDTKQIHVSREATSNLLVKTVLGDRARFDYTGTIRVEKDAMKTDAYQKNENLLLGSLSSCASEPYLEILADDVRCTHGAVTGPIPQDELWYMQSRGIPESSARRQYVEGFISSALDTIPDVRKKDEVWQNIQSAL